MGHNYVSWINVKSIWAFYQKNVDKMIRIAKEPPNQADNLLANAEITLSVDDADALAGLNIDKSTINSNLPDLKTLKQSRFEIIRTNLSMFWSSSFPCSDQCSIQMVGALLLCHYLVHWRSQYRTQLEKLVLFSWIHLTRYQQMRTIIYAKRHQKNKQLE